MTPVVSVIVPCFNQGRFISEALESLLGQSFTEWECIVVNDGSTDETQQVGTDMCRRDSRIRYVEQANRGLSGARNRGMEEARGRYLQFLDADDRLEHGKLALHVGYLDAHPGVDLVFGDVRYFTNGQLDSLRYSLFGDAEKYAWIPALWARESPILNKFVEGNLFAVNCPLVRRTVCEMIGKWNERLSALEDWEYWLRCAVAGFVFCFVSGPNALSLVRTHTTSMTHDQQRMVEANLQIRTMFGPKLRFSELRLRNFEHALDSINDLGEKGRYRRLLAAAWGNRTPLVLGRATILFARLCLANLCHDN